MFKAINGYTKARILEVIQNTFQGKSMKVMSNGSPSCAYRGENGSKCAVGLFIPDEVYRDAMDELDPKWNGTDVETSLQRFPELGQHMPLEVEALQKLQSIHDGEKLQYETDLRPTETIKNELLQWVETNVEES